MSRYVVFEPKGSGPSDRARFVRDGFSGWAFLFPFLWLFRYGLWISGLLVLALLLAIGWFADRPGLGLAGALLPFILGGLVALEGPSLRAARFRRKGYQETAIIEAAGEEDAALLYYAGSESNSVSRESRDDSRETPRFPGRPAGVASDLLVPRRTLP